MQDDDGHSTIAVVGFAVRLPKCPTVAAFWDNLCNARECITTVSARDSAARSPQFIDRAAALENCSSFDHEFFGLSKREALEMDPQHRLFLEECWHALEHAGHDPRGVPGAVGVFGSASYPRYLLHNLQHNAELMEQHGDSEMMVGNDKDYLCTRVSYQLNLHGPSVTVQTACSSSLVAIHLACQSLRSRDCDACLGGGVSVAWPPDRGYVYDPNLIYSKDGHCRPFDHRSSGTVFGSGVGVVVLKRLADALRDRNTIYCVIRATAVNNDGSEKIGMTAPSFEYQSAVLRECLHKAAVRPQEIAMIEAHGTATELGDMIELEAIKAAYELDSPQERTRFPCLIGSVKSNLGHMDAASGIVGLIKTALAIYNGTIPPTINFERLNPRLSLDDSRFVIADRAHTWNSSLPRRIAAVSSFGVGGTNAHAILEGYDFSTPARRPHPEQTQLIRLSARTTDRLEALSSMVKKAVVETADLDCLAYTLNFGRHEFSVRKWLAAGYCHGTPQVLGESAAADVAGADVPNVILVLATPDSQSTASYLSGCRSLAGFETAYEDYSALLQGLNDVELATAGGIQSAAAFAAHCALFRCLGAAGLRPMRIVGFDHVAIQAAAFLLEELSLSAATSALGLQALRRDFPSYLTTAVESVTTPLVVVNHSNPEIAKAIESCKPGCRSTLYPGAAGDMLHILGEIWRQGIPVCWQAVQDESASRRIAAPQYPFERNVLVLEPDRIACPGLWHEVWDVPVVGQFRSAPTSIYVVGSGLDEPLANFPVPDDGLCFIKESSLANFAHSLSADAWGAGGLDGPIVLAPAAKDLASARTELLSILRIVQMCRVLVCERKKVLVIVVSSPIAHATGALYRGLCASLQLEVNKVEIRYIQLGCEVSPRTLASAITGGPPICSVDAHGTFAPRYFRANPRQAITQLRTGANYLILGMGNAALLFARAFARRASVNLIFLSRTPEKRSGSAITVMNDIAALGSSVHALAADISDYSSLRAALQSMETRFGPIAGIVHAAGLAGKAIHFIDAVTDDLFDAYFSAKCTGTENILRATSQMPLDFCVFVSSTTAIMGGLGDALYASANALQGTMVEAAALRSGNAKLTCLDFDYLPRMFDDPSARGSGGFGHALFAHGLSGGEFEAVVDAISSLESGVHIVSKADPAHRRAEVFDLLVPEQSPVKSCSASSEATVDDVRAAWNEVLGDGAQEDTKNFFDAGGNSYLGIKLINRLNSIAGIDLQNVDLYDNPTITTLTAFIQSKVGKVAQGRSTAATPFNRPRDPQPGQSNFAVIGMSGRFPGARNVAELWENLLAKRGSIATFEPRVAPSGIYVPRRGIVHDVEMFDHQFFGISKKQADLMDPQQRLFLEHSWAALEDAGYIPDQMTARVGVFASACPSSYFPNVLEARGHLSTVDLQSAIINNSVDALATQVSYRFNLFGPSKTIQTFCSSSLVALHDACRSIQANECEVAVVGGVNVVVPQEQGYFFEESLMYSKAGEVRPFDRRADGTLFSNGIGVVVIKPLGAALRDRDPVQGVIKAIAINNDGARKVGFLAPSISGQAACVAEAYRISGLSPTSIAFVEAHATGTQIGDSIEVASLKQVFDIHKQAGATCFLGSIKGNIGHLDRAAGIVGFIKALLVARHKLIPPTANFEEARQDVDLTTGRLRVNSKIEHWNGAPPMRVAVNSMGVGGTNVHAIIESFDDTQPMDVRSCARRRVFKFSARSSRALERYLTAMRTFLAADRTTNLRDVAFTLACGRKDHDWRLAITAQSREELLSKLQQPSLVCAPRVETLIQSGLETGVDDPEALALRWSHGAHIDWSTLFAGETPHRISMPTYAFERIPCWQDSLACTNKESQRQVEHLETTFLHHIDALFRQRRTDLQKRNSES